MNTLKKILLYGLCVIVLVSATVLGTLAYLSDRESVTNTFTVGNVDITVDEAKVDEDGKSIDGADRVTGNEYHLIPGQTYTKDPTMTVKAKSEDSYVRMMLTINCQSELNAIFTGEDEELIDIFDGYDSSAWIYAGETVDTVNNTITYEFRYKEIVESADTDTVLEPLFNSFTAPGFLDGEDLKDIEDLEISVEGHAIQAATFEPDDANNLSAEDVAWAAFEAQNNPNP